MSLIGWVGRTLRIGIDGQVLAAVRAKSVAYVNTPVDVSDGERNGFRRIAEQGDVRSIEVSVDGVATSENWPILRDAWDGDEFVSLTIEAPDGTTFTADAVLAALSRTGEHSGAVSFSASFQLSGVLDDGDYLTSEVYPTPVGPSVVGSFTFTAGETVEFGETYRGYWAEDGYWTTNEDELPPIGAFGSASGFEGFSILEYQCFIYPDTESGNYGLGVLQFIFATEGERTAFDAWMSGKSVRIDGSAAMELQPAGSSDTGGLYLIAFGIVPLDPPYIYADTALVLVEILG